MAFGRKATHLLTRPDYVVFVDEVGSNTSQERDTTATSEPIMCALILEGKAMHPEVITGMGLFATKEGNKNDPDLL